MILEKGVKDEVDLAWYLIIIAASSTGSGRARSDPTHQHHRHHNHPHSHSSQQGAPPMVGMGYPTANSTTSMECESPAVQQARLQEVYRHQQSGGQLRQAWSGDVHTPHDRYGNSHSHAHHGHSHSHPQLQRHHSHPPAAAPPGVTPSSSSSSSSLSGQHQPHGHMGGNHGSGMVAPIAQTLLAGNMEPIVVAPPTRQQHSSALSSSAMTIDLSSLPAVTLGGPTGAQGVVESTQTGSVNMQLAGYHGHAPPGGNPSQQPYVGGSGGQTFIATGPSFPFTLATTSGGNLVSAPEGVSGHSRTAGERGEESPMVGVCVQQSPVASH